MSVVFVPERLRGKAEVNQETLRRLLEENDQLIRCIVEYQNKGRAAECVHCDVIAKRSSDMCYWTQAKFRREAERMCFRLEIQCTFDRSGQFSPEESCEEQLGIRCPR